MHRLNNYHYFRSMGKCNDHSALRDEKYTKLNLATWPGILKFEVLNINRFCFLNFNYTSHHLFTDLKNTLMIR